MDTPAPLTENKSAVSHFFLQHKLLLGLTFIVLFSGYILFIIRVYHFALGDSFASKAPAREQNAPVVSSAAENPAPQSTPTQPPRPTGPGPFACDQYGVCNIYEDAKRTTCPKTYADRDCLNECQKKDVRCPK